MREPLDRLAGIRTARDHLDEAELDLIDQARQAGATWHQVGAALGLGSRQAAEQRRQRLAAGRRARRVTADRRWPGEVAGLRALLAGLHRWIEADRRWDGRFSGAALTRHTIALALDAEPGALHDLARHVAADLATAGRRLPLPIRAVSRDLHTALSTVR
ncbi:hypothetical protein E0H26_02400 [Micromonospora zingiberis]|uniref:Uncharacterized protein n=1 Tax=Micromonospora zingiberis TaxID=2053011 RepID=A0A4R0GXD8_9ACTN|nr:hypothetical protein [Micromonospora zingiberis]TCC00552.1 hypothetical protein E0H26_02400 [Micromonospora zingiberis]